MRILKKLLKIIKILFLFVIIFILIALLYINFHPIFGDKPNAESMERIKKSPNFDGKHFKNLIPTNTGSIIMEKSEEDTDNFVLLKKILFSPKDKNPTSPIKTQALKVKSLSNGDFVWLGHSTVLFKLDNTIFITDPVFHNAAPLPFMLQPFKMTNTPTIKDLPFIDAVLISHDHYDHLDYKAIIKMQPIVGHFYVPLGVKAHLLRWGVPDNKVSEYDWYDDVMLKGIKLIFAPSRHFSGRGITNHRQTLWGSWAVISSEIKVYFSGDGGYSPEFAKIGKLCKGFDIAFIENGAYNKRWKDIHMFPKQSAQAGIDLQTKVVLPIHWGKFDLSTHQWKEPVQGIAKALDKYNNNVSKEHKIKLATPRIGEIFNLKELPRFKWWEE